MSDQTRTRLSRLTDLLIDAYPQGITTTEAATILNVTRQTIHKDIQRLGRDEVPVCEGEDDPNHYAINPNDYIRPLRLTLPQAWMLYLPLRRMIRAQMHNHHVVYTLLQRLMTAFDPIIGEHLLPDTSTGESPQADTFTHLVDSWRNHRLLAITYKPLNKPLARHLIAPYWFEPAVWSDSLYIIAGLHDRGQPATLVTLKLDRIESAAPRLESFDPPSPGEILDYLSRSWGVWGGETPVIVRLRFHNRQRQRLLETHWHPSEQISDEPDGSVIWQATIAEPQEMLPWVRGWGPDVEVLEPKSLRDQVAIDADRTARLYGFCEGDDSRSFLAMRKPKT